MVGFETGPMAEGECNDPLPFNFSMYMGDCF